MRKLNKVGSLDWDDPVPEELLNYLISELKNLVLAPEFVFSRSLKPPCLVGLSKLDAFWDG